MAVTLDLADVTQHGSGFPLNASEWNSRYTELDVAFQNETKDVAYRMRVVTMVAAENITSGDAIRIDSSGQAAKCDQTATGIDKFIGIATETVTTSNNVRIAIDIASGLTLTAGSKYYIGASGAITVTKPTSNASFIGVALDTSRLVIYSNFNNDVGVMRSNLVDLSLTYDSDDNGTGEFKVFSGPLQVLTVGNSGFFGIGTAVPRSQLDIVSEVAGNVSYTLVNKSASGSLALALTETDTGGSTPFYIERFNSSHGSKPNKVEYVGSGDISFHSGGTAERMTIKASGAIGVGTITPTSALEVHGELGIKQGDKLVLNKTAGSNNWIESETSPGAINFYVAGVQAVSFESNGNVGIGNFSPAEKLSVNGNIATSAIANTVFSNNFQIFNSASNMALNYSSASLVFSSDLGEKMRILRTGNVGIGTTTPSFLLNVRHGDEDGLRLSASSNTFKSRIDFGDDDDDDVGRIHYDHNDNSLLLATNAAAVLFINSSGTVGINTVTPSSSYKLDVNGDSRVGWHGSSTKIKILGSYFLSERPDRPVSTNSAINGGAFGLTGFSRLMQGFVPIPVGYKATDLIMYGDNTDSMTIYSSDINSAATASIGTGVVGTSIDITDTDSTTTNYIIIEIFANNGDLFYGGEITISRI